MKKKVLLMSAAIVLAITAFAAVNGTWIKVSDGEGCRGCTVTGTFSYCGKCRGTLYSNYLGSKTEGGRLYYYYKHTCSKCKHTNVYKTTH